MNFYSRCFGYNLIDDCNGEWVAEADQPAAAVVAELKPTTNSYRLHLLDYIILQQPDNERSVVGTALLCKISHFARVGGGKICSVNLTVIHPFLFTDCVHLLPQFDSSEEVVIVERRRQQCKTTKRHRHRHRLLLLLLANLSGG